MNHPLSYFSTRGRMARRDYLLQSLSTTLVFLAVLALQFSYEEAFQVALGLPPLPEGHALLILPLILLFVSAAVYPLALPLGLAAFALFKSVPGPVAAPPPWGDAAGLGIALYALASLLALAACWRSVALACRRLRDAGSSMSELLTQLGGLLLLCHLLGLGFPWLKEVAGGALALIPWSLAIFLQCRLLFRRSTYLHTDS